MPKDIDTFMLAIDFKDTFLMWEAKALIGLLIGGDPSVYYGIWHFWTVKNVHIQ